MHSNGEPMLIHSVSGDTPLEGGEIKVLWILESDVASLVSQSLDNVLNGMVRHVHP